MNGKSDLVDIDAEVRQDRAASWMVYAGNDDEHDKEVWVSLPKSLVVNNEDGTFTMPEWGDGYPNVWLGTTVEGPDQRRRARDLLEVPAVVHFISAEPLLGNIARSAEFEADLAMLDWVITGGESGPNFRPTNPDWFRDLRDQCRHYDVPFLFKQWGGKSRKAIDAKGRELDGVVWDQYPTPQQGSVK